MRLKHEMKFLKVVGKNDKNGKPIHQAICSCGKQYRGTMREFRHFKCDNTEKLPVKELFDRYSRSANDRGYKFNLSVEQFEKITQQNCYYCDSEPSMEIKGLKFNGVDRKINSHGYTIVNSVSCCGTCNKMKGSLNALEFGEKIKNIFTNYVKVYSESTFGSKSLNKDNEIY